MKRALVVILLLCAASMVFLQMGNAIVPPPPYSYAFLVKKNPVTWAPIYSANGTIQYVANAALFTYSFTGHGLAAVTNYTLIYYPDKAGNPWPRTQILCLGVGTSDSSGNLTLSGSHDTGDLPKSYDSNYPVGAKVWLVTSADVDCSVNPQQMNGWNPTNYLFELVLIQFSIENLVTTTTATVTTTRPTTTTATVTTTRTTTPTITTYTATGTTTATNTVNMTQTVTTATTTLVTTSTTTSSSTTTATTTTNWLDNPGLLIGGILAAVGITLLIALAVYLTRQPSTRPQPGQIIRVWPVQPPSAPVQPFVPRRGYESPADRRRREQGY